jgi:hypothetical protein
VGEEDKEKGREERGVIAVLRLAEPSDPSSSVAAAAAAVAVGGKNNKAVLNCLQIRTKFLAFPSDNTGPCPKPTAVASACAAPNRTIAAWTKASLNPSLPGSFNAPNTAKDHSPNDRLSGCKLSRSITFILSSITEANLDSSSSLKL